MTYSNFLKRGIAIPVALCLIFGCATPRLNDVPAYTAGDLIAIANQGITQSEIDHWGTRHGYSTLPGSDLPEGWAVVEGTLSMAELSGMSFDQVVRSRSVVIRPVQESPREHVQDRVLAVRFSDTRENRARYDELKRPDGYVRIKVLTFIRNKKYPCGKPEDNQISDIHYCIGPLESATFL